MKHITSALISALAFLIFATASHAALVPFTAMSGTDFSKLLEIYVPDGWTHRSAEGMMELKPSSGDGWLCVEAGKLGERTPTAWALLLSEGLHPKPTDASTNCYAWSGKNAAGEDLVHWFAASPEHNIYLHFTWTAGLDKTTEITDGSRLAGAPLSTASPADAGRWMNDSEVVMIMAFARWYDEREAYKDPFDPRIALSYRYADKESVKLLLGESRLEEHHNWKGSTKILRDAVGIECWYVQGGENQHEMVGAIDASGDAWVVLEVTHTPEPYVKLYRNGAETNATAPRELEDAVAASGAEYLLKALAEARKK